MRRLSYRRQGLSSWIVAMGVGCDNIVTFFTVIPPFVFDLGNSTSIIGGKPANYL